jgi:hypothetical protein
VCSRYGGAKPVPLGWKPAGLLRYTHGSTRRPARNARPPIPFVDFARPRKLENRRRPSLGRPLRARLHSRCCEKMNPYHLRHQSRACRKCGPLDSTMVRAWIRRVTPSTGNPAMASITFPAMAVVEVLAANIGELWQSRGDVSSHHAGRSARVPAPSHWEYRRRQRRARCCRQNPWFRIAQACSAALHRMMYEFGMTLSSRSRVRATPEHVDDIDEFLETGT